MKSISFFVVFLFSTSIYCQPKYLTYKSSYFSNKVFDIKLSSDNEKVYTLYIDMQSKDDTQNGGLIITHEEHQPFLDSLLKAKTKFVEWVNVAKKNNVTDFNKQIELDFNAPACYFNIDYKTYYHRSSNLVFLFNITKNKPMLSIWTQKLTASENRFLTNNGFFLVFTSEKEISDFINKISVQKVKDFIKKPKTSDLFKN